MALLLPFQLPNELSLSALIAQFPCREPQIRSLAVLFSFSIEPPRNLVLYGLEATGKSSITAAVLSALNASSEHKTGSGEVPYNKKDGKSYYAIVKSTECITGRHLLETTINSVARALGFGDHSSRCESLAQLVFEIGKLFEKHIERSDTHDEDRGLKTRFIMVFDGVDKQKDAPPTLLQALARMGEVIANLTVVFIVTSPRPHFLYTHGVPHLHFPSYTKSEAVQILSLNVPPIGLSDAISIDQQDDGKSQNETKDLWVRFCSAIWDTLSKHSGRDIFTFRTTCTRLWPSFTAPIREGTFAKKDFSRLLVSKRALFQDEHVLVPSIISNQPPTHLSSHPTAPSIKEVLLSPKPHQTGIASQLPYYSRLLLIAAYLASYTPPRHDTLLFSKASSSKRKKRGGGTAKTRVRASKHRKISGKLLGPQSFVLERMLAIFHAVRIDAGEHRTHVKGNWANADIPMAIATLTSLRLVIRGGANVLDASAKWKVNVGWEVVRNVARSVTVEIEDFLAD